MRLLAFTALCLSVVKADDCPAHHPSKYHEENVISGGKPAFEMIVESRRLVNEGYTPGEDYDIQVVARDTGIRRVNVSVFNDEGRCDVGSLDPDSGLTVGYACPNMFLREVSTSSKGIVEFEWRAPHCGCVTLWATVLSDNGLFYFDEDKSTGVLSKTFCMKETAFQCPQPYPAKYSGDNELHNGTPAFEMKVHEDFRIKRDGYEPGFEYSIDVIARDVELTRVNISAYNDEDECGIGHLVPKRHLILRRECRRPSLQEESSERKEIVRFTWQAPTCGCVTIWSTVLTERGTVFFDENQYVSVLSRRICRKGDNSAHDSYVDEGIPFVDGSFIDDGDEEFHHSIHDSVFPDEDEFHPSIHDSVFPDEDMDTADDYDDYEYGVYDGMSDIESRHQPQQPWRNYRHGYDSHSDERWGGRRNSQRKWNERHGNDRDSAASLFDDYEPFDGHDSRSDERRGTGNTRWHRQGGRPGSGRRNERRRWNGRGRYHGHDSASVFDSYEQVDRYDSHSGERSWWPQIPGWRQNNGRDSGRRRNTRGRYQKDDGNLPDEKDSVTGVEEQESQNGRRLWNGRRQLKFGRPGQRRWNHKKQPRRQRTMPWQEAVSATEETPALGRDSLDEDKHDMSREAFSNRHGNGTTRHRMKKLKKRCCLLGKSAGQKTSRLLRWRNCARSSSALVKKLPLAGHRLKKACMKVAKACCFQSNSRDVSVTTTPMSPTAALSSTSSEQSWGQEFPPGAKVVSFKIDVQPEKDTGRSSASIFHRQ